MQRPGGWRRSIPVLMAGLLMMGAATAAEPTPAYGPGMMGGYGMGPGMMGGYGMGPGMMGGYGMGPGMMGGYGPGPGGDGAYGPGMMGGYGMGPGMMGGYGVGPGMMGAPGMGMHMGLGPVWALDLNANQRRAIDNIMAEQHKQHWAAMSAMIGAQGRLAELQTAEQWDEKAIARVYDDIFKQQRMMIELSVRMRNRIYDQLTAEQKEQVRRWSWGGRWGR
jgi:P pilus assembly/Cpx signaling pathway, periplasmic inhibitor/zinc-resistance associated protein